MATVAVLSVTILGSSLQSASAKGPLESLRPSTPIDRSEHPVLQKLLVGVGLIGLGFAAGELSAKQPWDHPQGGTSGAQQGAYLRYNSQSGLEYGWNFN
jgi:hypothetical protein